MSIQSARKTVQNLTVKVQQVPENTEHNQSTQREFISRPKFRSRIYSFSPENPNVENVGTKASSGIASTVKETASIIKHSKLQKRTKKTKCCLWPLRNFVAFTFIFSLNHGCLSSVISLAPAALRTNSLGSYSIGTFFISAVIQALFFAAPIVDRLGSKWSMAIAMASAVLFIGCFLGAYIVDERLHDINLTEQIFQGSIENGISSSQKNNVTGIVLIDDFKLDSTTESVFNGITNSSMKIIVWFLAMFGALAGGIGAGLIWSAQG